MHTGAVLYTTPNLRSSVGVISAIRRPCCCLQARMHLASGGLEASFSEQALSRALSNPHHLGKRYLIRFLSLPGLI